MKECHEDGGKVFVHCFAGRSRSSTSVIAYLMQETGMSLNSAFKLVKRRRPIVYPNPGFQQ